MTFLGNGTRIVLIAMVLCASAAAGVWYRGSLPTTGTAYAKCQPSTVDPSRSSAADYPSSRLVGSYRRAWDVGASYIGGTYAQLWNYSPWVYPINSSASSVSAWVMVWNNNNAMKYAQVGWVEFPNGSRHTFRAARNQTVQEDADYTWAPQPSGSFTFYTVQYNDPSPGWVSYYIAGVKQAQTYTPINPNEGKLAGETHTIADQMPGGSITPMYVAECPYTLQRHLA